MASYSIRSSTIRLGIFISTLVIADNCCFSIGVAQKDISERTSEFDNSVIKAIRGLYEDIDASNYNTSYLNELIEKPEPHLYLAHITLPVNNDSIISYLQ